MCNCIIKADPGYCVVMVYDLDDGEVEVHREELIGWTCGGPYPLPISSTTDWARDEEFLADLGADIYSACRLGVQSPHGRVRGVGYGSYHEHDSLEAFVAAAKLDFATNAKGRDEIEAGGIALKADKQRRAKRREADRRRRAAKKAAAQNGAEAAATMQPAHGGNGGAAHYG